VKTIYEILIIYYLKLYVYKDIKLEIWVNRGENARRGPTKTQRVGFLRNIIINYIIM
jgi:hypothetical protein